MSKNYWAWEIQGTILETKKDKEKKKDKGGFLTPWTSLLPNHLREKLGPDVLAAYKDGRLIFSEDTDPQEIDLPFWGIIFPKRSYLPPEYPHLQLWLLGDYFAPSLYFVHKKEQKDLNEIAELMIKTGDEFIGRNKVEAEPTFAINATPFSFIKKEDGKYYGGGQSVRTFHLHFLLKPTDLNNKHEFSEQEAALVYPTTFAHELFQLIFLNSGMQKKIFGKTWQTNVTERGVGFEIKKDSHRMVSVLNKIDEVFYQLQLSLIYAFYTDSRHFLDKLSKFMTSGDLKELKNELDHLILVGKERKLEKAKQILEQELGRFAKKFGAEFLPSQVKTVVNELAIEEESGDLASWVGEQKVVLRPGMGYGLFAKVKDDKIDIHVAPEDSLKSEGTMESNGYYFTEKIKISKKPDWFDRMKNYLDQFSS